MYSNILLPLAFDERVDYATPIDLARRLKSDGAKVTLLHVFDVPPAYAMQYIPADMIKAQREGVLEDLKQAATGIDGGKALIKEGSPGRTISDFAKADGVDLIIMASHRPGMSDFVWGSTAGFVVRHVPCAVHVIR